jgi:MtN3 and saliva related transmembrane protein
MNLINIIGTLAVILGPLSFLTQVVKTWRTKETKDISLAMYVIFWAGVVLWLTYGIVLKDSAVIINNIIMFTLTTTMLAFKLKYK